MSFDIKSHLKQRLDDASNCYLSDLKAMPEELLGKSPGGSARSPFDFTYEIAVVNRRIANRIRGEEVEAMNTEGWMTAPEEFRTKDASLAMIQDTVNDILEAWKALPNQDVERPIVLPTSETTPVKLMSLAATHMMYHDAQLNYLQAIEGDEKVHWEF